MPLPTRSACSAEASLGGQMSWAGAAGRVEPLAAGETASVALGPIVGGSETERSTLGGVTIDMMSVGAGTSAVVNVALGPGATPVTLGVAVPFVLVPALPLVAVAVVAVVMAGAVDKLGKVIAPDVAAGEVPGGGGGGPVVVVAMVEGEVELGVVLVEEVDDADCASAGPTSAKRIAAARARPPDLSAIAAPA